MPKTIPPLTTSQAAKRLGISAKALRLYEERGLLNPARAQSGWRQYEAAEMKRAEQIVALRDLGLSLADVKQVLDGGRQRLSNALQDHCERLTQQVRDLQGTIAVVEKLQQDIVTNATADLSQLSQTLRHRRQPRIAFALPWPWDGEAFEMPDIGPLNFITGPLASGKTRLAIKIADALPNGTFIPIDRHAGTADKTVAISPELQSALDWLTADGAVINDALIALLRAMHNQTDAAPVVDLIEQDLCTTTQEALMRYLRLRPDTARPLFVMTRSTAILDMELVQPNEHIIFCPANHSPPMHVLPIPGTPGYEGVASCLATPEVRNRSAGVVAIYKNPKAPTDKLTA